MNKESEKDYERLTPPEIIHALGEFDLDPAAPIERPWPMAKHHYTIIEDGLVQPWFGRVWLNPMYGKYAKIWLELLHKHGNGIALVPARTGSPWFHRQVYEKGDSILYLEDRIWYYNSKGVMANGNAGHDSVLIAYGENNMDAISDSGLKGHHEPLNKICMIIVGVSASWKSVIKIAMRRLNGEAHVQEVYETVKLLAPDKVDNNINWKEKIRQQLQYHFTRIAKGQYTNAKTNENQKNKSAPAASIQ